MGNGTRCYLAHDFAERRLVFVKDFWYEPHPTLQTEDAVYRVLAKAGVRNVAKVVWGGDVHHQQTAKTRKYSRFRHHRIIFQTVGRRLGSHVDQPELIRAMRDALVGMRSS